MKKINLKFKKQVAHFKKIDFKICVELALFKNAAEMVRGIKKIKKKGYRELNIVWKNSWCNIFFFGSNGTIYLVVL